MNDPSRTCSFVHEKMLTKTSQLEEGRTGWLWLFRLGRNVWGDKKPKQSGVEVSGLVSTCICFRNCLSHEGVVLQSKSSIGCRWELEVVSPCIVLATHHTSWAVQPSCQYFQKIFLSFLLNKNISWQIPIIFQYERDMRGYRQGQWLLIRPNLLCLLFWPVSLSLPHLTLTNILLHLTKLCDQIRNRK